MKINIFFMQTVLMCLCFGNVLFLDAGEHEKGRDPAKAHEAEERLKTIDKDIKTKINEAEVARLRAKEAEGEAERERYEKEEEEKRTELKTLLEEAKKANTSIKEFGSDEQRETAESKEKDLDKKLKSAEERIAALEAKLGGGGQPVNPPKEETNPIEIMSEAAGEKFDAAKEKETNTRVSSRFLTRLEAFYNEFKAKINETIVDNPKKVVATREKLNTLYERLGDVEKQIKNLIKLGEAYNATVEDPKKNSIFDDNFWRNGHDQWSGYRENLKRQIFAFDIYATLLDKINQDIEKASGTTKTKLIEQKKQLQLEALQEIISKGGLHMEEYAEFNEELLGNIHALLTDQKFVDLLKSEGLKKALTDLNQSVDIAKKTLGELISNLLNEKNPWQYLLTEAEKKTLQENKKNAVLDFLQSREKQNNFLEALGRYMYLATHQDITNIPDFRKAQAQLNEYTQFFENLNFSDFSAEQRAKLATMILRFYDRVTQGLNADFAKHFTVEDAFPKEMRFWDGIYKQANRESIYDYVLSQYRIGDPILSTKVANIIEENSKARTNSKAIQERTDAIVQQSIFLDNNTIRDARKKVWGIRASFEDFKKNTDKFLTDVKAADPSVAVLKNITSLKNIYEATANSIKDFVLMAQAGDRVMGDAEKDTIIKAYIDANNYQIKLAKLEAEYRDQLTVVIDGALFLLPMVDRKNVGKLERADGSVEAQYKKELEEIRNLNGTKRLTEINYSNKATYKEYKDFLFGQPAKNPEKKSSSGGGSESGDEGVPG